MSSDQSRSSSLPFHMIYLCSRLRLKGKMWEQTRSDNPKEKALVRLWSWTTPFLYFRWRTCRNRTGGSLEKWNMHVKFQSYKPTPSYPAKTEICSSSKIFLTVNQLWVMNYFSIILQLTGVLQEVRYFLQDNTCQLQTSASSCVENRAGSIQRFPPWMMLYECKKKKLDTFRRIANRISGTLLNISRWHFKKSGFRYQCCKNRFFWCKYYKKCHVWRRFHATSRTPSEGEEASWISSRQHY